MIDFRETWCFATEENYKALEKVQYLNLKGLRSAYNKEVNVYYKIYDSLDTWVVNSTLQGFPKGKQIHLVNGEFQYVDANPKNNFNEYGFEADFEGEVLKCFNNTKHIKYIGYFINDCKYPVECHWDNKGNNFIGSYSNSEYNIKPIKKEWYENIDCNKPVHFIDLETDTLGLAHGYNMNGDYCLNDFWKNSLSHIFNARPATKEEVLNYF